MLLLLPQLCKNTKTDAMVKNLYVENAQLLKALEMTEQRQKTAEKKNYLLEEKIASLSTIVRNLAPAPLASTPPLRSQPYQRIHLHLCTVLTFMEHFHPFSKPSEKTLNGLQSSLPEVCSASSGIGVSKWMLTGIPQISYFTIEITHDIKVTFNILLKYVLDSYQEGK